MPKDSLLLQLPHSSPTDKQTFVVYLIVYCNFGEIAIMSIKASFRKWSRED